MREANRIFSGLIILPNAKVYSLIWWPSIASMTIACSFVGQWLFSTIFANDGEVD